MGGDPQGEGGAGTGFAPELDVTAVVGRNVLDDRQPQPGATGRSTARLIDPEEPLEDAFLMLGSDTEAAVGDGDLHEATLQPPADRHRAARLGIGDRVVEQVG